MGICNLGSCDHLLHSGILDTESNVVENSIIEENRFLIDVADKAAQILYAVVTDILASMQISPAATS